MSYRLHKITVGDTVRDLPEAIPLENGSINGGLFICALGFEPRCLTIPEFLGSSEARFRVGVCLLYSTNRSDNELNRSRLRSAMEKLCDRVEYLSADEPGFFAAFESELDRFKGRKRVVFDVSVVANRLIFTCMRAILDRPLSLSVVYSEAAKYFPIKAQYTSSLSDYEPLDGLDFGVSNIEVSQQFPGLHLDPLPHSILIFPSFGRDRVYACIAWVDPSLATDRARGVVWFLGVPHLPRNHWRVEAVRRVNGIQSSEPCSRVSTFDYRDTLLALERVYLERGGVSNLTLCPLGSKMQALGSALYCYFRPSVRVVFAFPKEYRAAQYSDGCRQMWIIEFGETGRLTSLLNRVDQLSLVKERGEWR